jgi:hypothetical protein
MGHTQAFEAFLACFPERRRSREPGLRGLLGDPAWQRLPAAVRERFGEPLRAAVYAGGFEVVEASLAGRALALLARRLATPVVPRTGRNVPAVVRVGPEAGGVRSRCEYRWPDARVSRVRTTWVIDAGGTLVEKLPAGLCRELAVREAGGALQLVSRRTCFELPIGLPRRARWRLPLPRWLSPGHVQVVHEDQAGGWFRFTMTVTHPLLGRLFHQSGCFHAMGD